jgi:hypothetical protein
MSPDRESGLGTYTYRTEERQALRGNERCNDDESEGEPPRAEVGRPGPLRAELPPACTGGRRKRDSFPIASFSVAS